MNYFLHIETATDVCSVAISRGTEMLVLEEEKNSLKHSEIITIQIKKVIEAAGISLKDLSAVSLSKGPGSYTSLRVGMSAAKAICFAHDIPLIGVNTLESLAFPDILSYDSSDLICSMIDARRMEVYASLYTTDANSIFDNKPVILNKNTFDYYIEKGHEIIISGNGAIKSKELFESEKIRYSNIVCSAKNLINLTIKKFDNKDFEDLAYFSPNYIKPPNITTPKVKLL